MHHLHTVQCCTILHCTALYCTVLHCTEQYITILYCIYILLYDTSLYCTSYYTTTHTTLPYTAHCSNSHAYVRTYHRWWLCGNTSGAQCIVEGLCCPLAVVELILASLRSIRFDVFFTGLGEREERRG